MSSVSAQNVPPLEASGADDIRNLLPDIGVQVTLPSTTLSAHWLLSGEQRLDAEYYSNEAFAALRAVEDSGHKVEKLGRLVSEVSYPGRFKRVFAKFRTSGVPFLTASGMLYFRPSSEQYLARLSKSLADCLVQPGWLLVTRSGTVGRCVIVGKRLGEFAISDDAIRIRTGDCLVGFLFAFLMSRVGQALLAKDQYGSAIKHLEPHHVEGVPVPLLPEADQRAVHEAVMQAFALRDEANALLDEADDQLHHELGLARFDLSLVPYLALPSNGGAQVVEMPHPRAFTMASTELAGRFDASYHLPVARTAVRLLQKAKHAPVPLGTLASSIYIPPRFKRIYVTKEHGVPFLRPSQLPQIRPHDLGYISRLTPVLDNLLLRAGDVLVTTDGTVGRVGVVTPQIAGWAGSNNIGRITYGNDDGRNGYLAAFLSNPYGFHQLTRLIYGGVIDHIEVPHIAGVMVPNAPLDVQRAIGCKVVSAFEKKDEAAAIEAAAIRRVEEALERPARIPIVAKPEHA